MVIVSNSPEQTEAIGQQLSSRLTGPVCITLTGELGAGKTRIVRGLVAGWGGDVSQVSSPTYVLINRYQTPRGTIFHLDAYRVSGPDDFDAIGFEELLEQTAMVVVEWPQRVKDLLPAQKIEIFFQVSDPAQRRIEIVEAKQ